jgi:phage shock protein PspC (stress-responsive transcriptional regulator)
VKTARIDGALLAGVCAGMARTFGWNVWALRVLFVIFLLIKTVWAIVAYTALALIINLLDGEWSGRRKSDGGLESPELAGRSRRIAELEKRFEELERRE